MLLMTPPISFLRAHVDFPASLKATQDKEPHEPSGYINISKVGAHGLEP